MLQRISELKFKNFSKSPYPIVVGFFLVTSNLQALRKKDFILVCTLTLHILLHLIRSYGSTIPDLCKIALFFAILPPFHEFSAYRKKLRLILPTTEKHKTVKSSNF